MGRNRIKQKNTIQARRLWHWFAICALFTVFGLVFVFLQIRIHQLAETREERMQELEEIQQKNKSLRVAIERHKNPDELKKKIAEFQLGMVEMSDPEIVVIETGLSKASTMARRGR